MRHIPEGSSVFHEPEASVFHEPEVRDDPLAKDYFYLEHPLKKDGQRIEMHVKNKRKPNYKYTFKRP
jgi:hypothetical protein